MILFSFSNIVNEPTSSNDKLEESKDNFYENDNFKQSNGKVYTTFVQIDDLTPIPDRIGAKQHYLAEYDYDEAKREYDQIKYALKMVKQTGYGVASPTLKDMKLDTPEIIKQGNRYGVKLKAVAPSIHMIRVDVNSTFEPIIGSELQSKELINYLMKDYETNPQNIWKSEIFGRSLDVIVQEGIQSKISLMPENIRYKLSQTLTKIVNKGSNNLIAIVI